MQIFVRSLDKTIVVSLDEGSTVQDLKSAIEDVEFVPARLQHIVKESTAVSEGFYPVLKDKDVVTLLMGVDGGMRAKWRKKRMRRLRRKRRKMRMRAK